MMVNFLHRIAPAVGLVVLIGLGVLVGNMFTDLYFWLWWEILAGDAQFPPGEL